LTVLKTGLFIFPGSGRPGNDEFAVLARSPGWKSITTQEETMSAAFKGINKVFRTGSLILVLAAGVSSQFVAAAEWAPSDRITLVSQSSPGTGNELMLRELADIWNKNKMIPRLAGVENVTGSQGEKMRRYVIVQNKGNAHMLAAYTPSTLNSALLMKSDTGWKQFTPIAMLISDPAVVVVNAEGPKSLKELVEMAKARPKQILQGGGAYGSSASLAGKLLEEATGIVVSYTPFKGGGEAILQLLGKHIHFVIENPGEVAQHIQAGKLRAVAASDRIAQMPEIPTYAEAGFKVRTLKQFRAVMAPPGIAPEVVRYYVSLLERTRQTQQWKDYVKKSGVIETWMTGAELGALFEQEEKEYQRLNTEMGLVK